MTISATKTVRELAVEVPSATRLFEKLGIDYCCGGGKSLEEACFSAGVETDEVINSLEGFAQAGTEVKALKDWQSDTLQNLITHILDKHHVYTKEELERITPLMTKVATVYRERRPELERVQGLFLELKRELITHMLKEEQVLFPYVEQMEDAAINKITPPRPFFGTVQNPVRMMMIEHDAAGEMLRELRSLTNNYTAPEDACISYKTLYQALEEFEQDLHQHIHLENNILFPRAAEMESAF